MKKKIALFLFFIFLSTLFSFSKDSDAEYLYLRKEYKLNKDGSWVLTYSSKVKLHTYLAVRRLFGETFIVYNPEYQTLKVLKSETTMKDGKKVPTPPNGYNEILPRNAHGFYDFSHLREMVVSHTGLERGAVEELKYTLSTKKEFSPYFFMVEPLSKNVSVNEYEISFMVPKDFEFNYEIKGNSLDISKEDKGEFIVYKFYGKNLKALKHFENKSEIPYLFVIANNKVENIDNLIMSSGSKLPEAVIKKLEKFKAESSDIYELLFKIQDYVAADIETARVGIEFTGYHTRNLEKIIASGYATPLEKTKLLFSILKYFNLKPEVIFLSRFEKSKYFLPEEKVFVKADANGEEYYIDPLEKQSQFYPYGYEGLFARRFNGEKFELSKKQSVKDNVFYVKGKILFSGEGEFTLKLKGYFNDYRKILKNETAFINSIFKSAFGVKFDKTIRTNVKTPNEFISSFVTKGLPFKKSYNYNILEGFNVPYFIKKAVFLNFEGFVVPFSLFYEVEYELPKNSEMEFVKDDIDLKNTCGEYKRLIKRNGKNVKIIVLFSLNGSCEKSREMEEIERKMAGDKELFIFMER